VWYALVGLLVVLGFPFLVGAGITSDEAGISSGGVLLRVISTYKGACIDGLKCKLVRLSKERRPAYI